MEVSRNHGVWSGDHLGRPWRVARALAIQDHFSKMEFRDVYE